MVICIQRRKTNKKIWCATAQSPKKLEALTRTHPHQTWFSSSPHLLCASFLAPYLPPREKKGLLLWNTGSVVKNALRQSY